VKILFDQGTPVPLRASLIRHSVETAHERGWATLGNGELLRTAEAAGFEVLVTTDQNLGYQQNLADRSIAVIVLSSTSWPRIRKSLPSILGAVESALPGAFIAVDIP
jgi:hypothetical protein